MKFLRYILFPIVPIYYAVTWLRNYFYDIGVFKSKSYHFPVIAVGNLSVGGTGKTPMVEYLIGFLKDKKHIATLSRGYKRSTEGFYLADKNASAKTLGDEPFQFYRKFKNEIDVAVDADRQNGIAHLMQQEKAPEVILLDDAYQHRKVQAGFYILLTTYHDLFTKDWVLPTGNLREPRAGAKRANCIVVTKCPENLNALEKDKIIKQIQPKASQQVFFSTIRYSNYVLSENKKLNLETLQDFTLVTGIANATPLVDYLKAKELKFKHLHYKDHYDFTDADIALFREQSLIVTTEKDYVRLLPFDLQDKVFYLPIEIHIDKTEAFNTSVLDFILT
ncbi:tetraacyldisaccharide 4'-kinase [Lacinutrix sp. C3R15]|uniref:tetraacyldisaccharide 4'-kinase n=1 Tax=Flavobacteriaceae TaxID=49546 RepID=UPI001C093FE4|nr:MULTISPECIES: tetraacyldisaccharide 4'-kinase [Flavobacteriaceae]MBU2939314.1 tetraacyldisaccharide 4'-kinase [Lacinutrix sp. C3R15]MDO6622629.1 tetraacyldisaccharide 4'-kinase [Oceanihabitans sp. 1_MG-2023]